MPSRGSQAFASRNLSFASSLVSLTAVTRFPHGISCVNFGAAVVYRFHARCPSRRRQPPRAGRYAEMAAEMPSSGLSFPTRPPDRHGLETGPPERIGGSHARVFPSDLPLPGQPSDETPFPARQGDASSFCNPLRCFFSAVLGGDATGAVKHPIRRPVGNEGRRVH